MSKYALPAPLGLKLKLSRARKHLRHLRRVIERFEASNPYMLHRRVDANGRYYLYSIQLAEAPHLVELLADEAIHHLRTVLDHLISATVESVGKKVTAKHAFPIRRKEPKTPKEIADYRAMLKHVPRDARTVIYLLQPFHRGADAKSHPLAILARLDNRFKHTGLHLLSHQVECPKVAGIIQPPAPAKRGRDSGDVFAKVPVTVDVQKHFEPYVSVEIAFSMRVTGVRDIKLDTLDSIYNYVRDEVIRKAVRFKRLPNRL